MFFYCISFVIDLFLKLFCIQSNGNANTLSGPIRRRSRPADVDTNTRVNASAAHAKTLPAGGLAQASAQAASADFRDKPWYF